MIITGYSGVHNASFPTELDSNEGCQVLLQTEREIRISQSMSDEAAQIVILAEVIAVEKDTLRKCELLSNTLKKWWSLGLEYLCGAGMDTGHWYLQ